MGTADKARDKGQEAKGKAKEVAGKATNNPTRTGKGQREQTKANLKQAGEKTKDAFKS
jgi:uncharacterized protein YjbJ (UPF0337 family)